jgi:hypothetical protein
MGIDKLVDPGEVYIIGEYEVGTATPTGRYKIGMVQNNRTSYDRITEHQTGNPNRLFIADYVVCEASHLVEKLMHAKWNSERISQEWFDLSATGALAQASADIRNFEAQYGISVARVRAVYYSQPNSGNHPGLSRTEIAQAESWRDEVYELCKDMAKLKFEYKTLEFQLLTMNGVNVVVDSVSRVNITPAYTEFAESLIDPALKALYMTKTQKRKSDFKFIFTQNSSHLCDIKLTSAHWKTTHSTEEAAHEAAKIAWGLISNTITPTTAIATVQTRTPTHETLHESYVEKLKDYDEKKYEKEIIELQLRIMCYDYEGIAGVCSWKRGTQSNKFNKTAFKVLEPTIFADDTYKAPKGDTANPSIIKFKSW